MQSYKKNLRRHNDCPEIFNLICRRGLLVCPVMCDIHVTHCEGMPPPLHATPSRRTYDQAWSYGQPSLVVRTAGLDRAVNENEILQTGSERPGMGCFQGAQEWPECKAWQGFREGWKGGTDDGRKLFCIDILFWETSTLTKKCKQLIINYSV